MIEIIKNLPLVLLLFVPGYIGYFVFIKLSGGKKSDNTPVVSCVFSFISLSIVKLFISTEDVFVEAVATTITCVIFSVIASYLVHNKGIRTYLVNHLKISLAVGPWEDSFNYDTGTRIRLQFKDKYHIPVIVGTVYSIGNVVDNPWIALVYYSFFESVHDEKPYYTERNGEHIFIVNTNDIESAELWPLK